MSAADVEAIFDGLPEEPRCEQGRAVPSVQSREARDELALRGFCSRILGWSTKQAGAVERALHAIHRSTLHRAPLVLLGDGDLVPVAQALHRRSIGAEQPFVVCDRRRLNTGASVRSPANYESIMAAMEVARGGSLCVRHRRTPHGFSSMITQVLDSANPVQLIVCAEARHAKDALLPLLIPIQVPSLSTRMNEVPRIVDEYAADAIGALGAPVTGFTSADRAWVLEHAFSLPAIEKATLRLVALRMARSVAGAAKLLGMSHVSLGHWIYRRRLLRSTRPST